MGRPYSLIRKADELKAALTNYETWLKKDAATKSQKYKEKIEATTNTKTARDNVEGYLYPFGISRTKGIIVACLIPAASGGTAEAGKTTKETGLTAQLRTAVIGDAAASKFIMPAKPASVTVIGKKLARQSDLAKVTLVDVGDKVSPEGGMKSRITGRPYRYRKRNSISIPFGQSTTNEDYGTAKEAIKTAALVKPTQRILERYNDSIRIYADSLKKPMRFFITDSLELAMYQLAVKRGDLNRF